MCSIFLSFLINVQRTGNFIHLGMSVLIQEGKEAVSNLQQNKKHKAIFARRRFRHDPHSAELSLPELHCSISANLSKELLAQGDSLETYGHRWSWKCCLLKDCWPQRQAFHMLPLKDEVLPGLPGSGVVWMLWKPWPVQVPFLHPCCASQGCAVLCEITHLIHNLWGLNQGQPSSTLLWGNTGVNDPKPCLFYLSL